MWLANTFGSVTCAAPEAAAISANDTQRTTPEFFSLILNSTLVFICLFQPHLPSYKN
jgi:hypothetical protein